MKNNKGITLMALVITIIILMILASISIYSAKGTIQYSKFNKAKSEMELIQASVNAWNQEYNNLETDQLTSKEKKQKDYIEAHGANPDTDNLTTLQEAGMIADKNWKYLAPSYIKNNLGIDSSFEYLVNIPQRKVILLNGFEYQDKTYYSADDFDILNVAQVEPVHSVDFNLETKDAKKEITIENLTFKDGNNNTVDVSKFSVEYSLYGENDWKNVSTKLTKFEEDGSIKYKFNVNEPGVYNVRIATTDKKINKIVAGRIRPCNYAEEEIDFMTPKMINTDIMLFSKENRDKDFRIRFTIDELGNNTQNNTLISAKREDNTSLYPGLTFRCSATNKYQFRFDVNQNVKQVFEYTASELLHNETTISKIDNVIYIQAAGSERKLVVDLKTVDTTQFYEELEETVLTLGAAFKNEEAQGYFSGKVSNVEISIFDHIDTIKKERLLYAITEPLVFDKTESKVLVFDGEHGLPEIRFFTAENINKDFEIKIKVESFGNNSYTKQDTIISTKLETKGSTAVVPGFVFRRTSATAFEIKGNSTNNGWKSGTANKTMIGKTVTIKRTDGVYTAQIGDEIKNFTTTATQNNITPLVIGGLIYTNGEIDRMVNCTVSELSIKIYDEVSVE